MHQSVLLEESINGLAIHPDGVYVDATFGRGGHSRAILERLSEQGRLIAIDKDPEAIQYAGEVFAQEKRFEIFHGSFADIAVFAEKAGVSGVVDGVLMDLGVSSPQLDDAERGFSFLKEGPLDMRMNLHQKLDAATFVNRTDEQEMKEVFRKYGEERFAGRIARAIVAARQQSPILTTQALAEIVKAANPKWEKHKHPATRVFQAIRIYINDELSDLEKALKSSVDVLKIGGRLAVISFHSLEDRIVKQFMKAMEEGNRPPPGVPVKYNEIVKKFRRVGKAIMPEESEIKENVRSRSAVLRIGEKLS
ncbi:S-adenosylmethyl transferase MraW [Legionella quinlivanii]|uniref:Ribosomal RNA small subunit methyltransferase H n=1 Tax=Legionella quinlivanii TaxID=45073 RepID=A0A0W0XXU8_9GAMM|nr:16S rRNA (cytosine(1402)-N(4))-methyltransferase RsmH [Legionella quinlivanii]KTD49124.1 S-adenosylmethyl transferase MraW [Legionella quinlivanii]MCW8450218.1 16S rRNA (cytosine(1402)-N(4))-methyltransferase RsmH [Legionella quinlivanii]SEG43477.1 16S rRNA (cytosine1402-N4)-methyltransferase [Legionella quinlivanii DSM 21216]STY11633.1 S-adenosylmethyl transferase MraW [Legionella quinlivanii]